MIKCSLRGFTKMPKGQFENTIGPVPAYRHNHDYLHPHLILPGGQTSGAVSSTDVSRCLFGLGLRIHFRILTFVIIIIINYNSILTIVIVHIIIINIIINAKKIFL